MSPTSSSPTRPTAHSGKQSIAVDAKNQEMLRHANPVTPKPKLKLELPPSYAPLPKEFRYTGGASS